MSHGEHQWPKALELKLSQATKIHGVEKKDMHSQMEKMNDKMTAERVDNTNRYVYHSYISAQKNLSLLILIHSILYFTACQEC